MRRVLFGVACSLDGYIAREDDGVDWLHWSDDVAAITAAYWKSIDAVVMGRRTWQVAAANGIAAYPGVANYVFSRTLAPDDAPGVQVVHEEPAPFVDRLRREPGGGICVMGGGELARALFEGGVVDDIGVNIQPRLLGSGIPLFPGTWPEAPLELTECREIGGGCVYLLYRVRR